MLVLIGILMRSDEFFTVGGLGWVALYGVFVFLFLASFHENHD